MTNKKTAFAVALEKHGLSQANFGYALVALGGWKLNENTLSRWYRGFNDPHPAVLAVLALWGKIDADEHEAIILEGRALESKRKLADQEAERSAQRKSERNARRRTAKQRAKGQQGD